MATPESPLELPDQSRISIKNNSKSDGDEIRQVWGSLEETKQKHVQIVRNFFTKCVLVILRRREDASIKCRQDGSVKVNKWFEIELDETTHFENELQAWNAYKTVHDPLPPLVLEVYLDRSEIVGGGVLSVITEYGVYDIPSNLPGNSCDEILLERWKIEYSPTTPEPDHDFYHVMPKFYKECVIFFRALFTITSLLPTWRLWDQIKNEREPTSRLAIRCRFSPINKEDDDTISQPICWGESYPVTDQVFIDKIQAPLGTLYAQITYRKEWRFFVKSNAGLLADKTLARDTLSLDQGHESQNLRSRRTMRSRSLPGRVLQTDELSLRHRSRSFSTVLEWLALARTNSENTLSTHGLFLPSYVPKDKASSLQIPNPFVGRGMSLQASEEGMSLGTAPRGISRMKRKCPYCDTEFTRLHNLKSHLLTHSQEKPYACQTCQMRFRRLFDLRRHMKLHTEERPHICLKCDRKFTNGDALERHSKHGCAGITRRPSFGSDNESAEPERGRSWPTTPVTPQGSRRRSSAHSRASSGGASTPASLRNISVAPKEFDPSVPTLRHNYSAPDLQDWSNVQARRGRRHSVSPMPNKSRRSNSLPALETSVPEFLEFLKTVQSLKTSTKPDLSSQSTKVIQGVETQSHRVGSQLASLVPAGTPRRRRHSQIFDVSPPLSDDEGGVRLRVQRRCRKARRLDHGT